MAITLANIRDSVMLTAAVTIGAIAAPVVPVIGLPMCGAALGGLVYRKLPVVAAIAATLSVALVGTLAPAEAVTLALAVSGVLLAIVQLRHQAVLRVIAWFIPLLTVAFAAREVASAWFMGITLSEYYARVAAEATVLLTKAGFADLAIEQGGVALLRFAAAGYLLSAVVTVVPTVAAVLWAARRSGAEVRTAPRLDQIDLSIHVLWIVLGAAAFGAAGRVWGGTEGVLTTIAVNLLVAAKVVLFTQGMAVVVAAARARKVSRVGIVFAFLLAMIVEGPTWAVSILGLLDFWVNFRRLERADGTGPHTEGPATGV